MRDLFRLDGVSRPALMLIVGRAVGVAAAFAIPIGLARMFAPAEFGTYKQLFLIYGTLYIVAQLGMAESLYYFVPRARDRASSHVANAVALLGLAGVGAMTLLVVLRDRIAAWLSNPTLAEYLPLLGAALAVMLLTSLFEIVLIARKRYRIAAWTYGLSDVTRMLFIVTPALVFGELRLVLIGAIGFALARFAGLIWTVRRELGSLAIDLSLARRQLAYALPFAGAVAIEVAQANLHQYVVAAQFDAATFAIYAVGCLQIPLVDLMATSAANVMMVKMSADGADRRGPAAVALWHSTICRLALVVFPLTAFLLLAARDVIVLLFTSTYAASVPIFMLWVLTFLPAVLCVDAVLRVYAATRFLFVMNIVRLGLMAGGIGWFLSAFGMAGAVLITLATTCVAKAVGLVKIARLLDVPVRAVLPWGRLVLIASCAGVSTLPAWWLARLSSSLWLDLLISGAAYAGTYAVACWAYTRHDSAAAARLETAPVAATLADS